MQGNRTKGGKLKAKGLGIESNKTKRTVEITWQKIHFVANQQTEVGVGDKYTCLQKTRIQFSLSLVILQSPGYKSWAYRFVGHFGEEYYDGRTDRQTDRQRKERLNTRAFIVHIEKLRKHGQLRRHTKNNDNEKIQKNGVHPSHSRLQRALLRSSTPPTRSVVW